MTEGASSGGQHARRDATRLVIHADDVGMCHGANSAFVELSHQGGITAGSVMVPCPWFPEIADLAARDDLLDVGVHLTLNAEKAHYRWRPVSGVGASSGLVDAEGYLWHRVADTRANAHPEAVETEWRAQIDTALGAGIDVTHLDAHMGSALGPEWCDRYINVGIDYDIPVLITRALSMYGPNNHLADVTDVDFERFVAQAEAARMPVFDEVLETDFSRPRGEPTAYETMLTASDVLAHDLVFCAFHPNAPGPGEIEVIEPDTWHVRTDEHALFGTDEWLALLNAQPFELTTMRELRAEYRTATARQR
ncbi:MAG: ChbG/HpnK family deacetylase [Ilumatobacter sp.]|uniref:ChbG/HpnK family deacetylase n=1 Tax=Ilumatobacter sp. TaxID=1967498 RepID=UPI003750DCC1|nr:ChbG/HpnK family deacetylase [Ilumatobacter sp.]